MSKLAIVELPDNWERGKCQDCLLFDAYLNCNCIFQLSPSSNNGCGLIVDEGIRDEGPLDAYSRNRIMERLQQHKEDYERLIEKLMEEDLSCLRKNTNTSL